VIIPFARHRQLDQAELGIIGALSQKFGIYCDVVKGFSRFAKRYQFIGFGNCFHLLIILFSALPRAT
jgi:hypothetical protein